MKTNSEKSIIESYINSVEEEDSFLKNREDIIYKTKKYIASIFFSEITDKESLMKYFDKNSSWKEVERVLQYNIEYVLNKSLYLLIEYFDGRVFIINLAKQEIQELELWFDSFHFEIAISSLMEYDGYFVSTYYERYHNSTELLPARETGNKKIKVAQIVKPRSWFNG